MLTGLLLFLIAADFFPTKYAFLGNMHYLKNTMRRYSRRVRFELAVRVLVALLCIAIIIICTMK